MSKRDVDHAFGCEGAGNPLDHELEGYISVEGPASPIASHNIFSFNIAESSVGLKNLTVDKLLLKLLLAVFLTGKVYRINGYNVLLGSVLLIKIVLVFFEPIIPASPGISRVLEIFFVSNELYGFIIGHHLA